MSGALFQGLLILLVGWMVVGPWAILIALGWLIFLFFEPVWSYHIPEACKTEETEAEEDLSGAGGTGSRKPSRRFCW